MNDHSISRFLWLGRLEGISLLALFFFAMPMKYIYGDPSAVRVIGMVHGILFILYVAAAFSLSDQRNWPTRKLLLCILLSCAPFGTFYFEKKLSAPATP